MMFEMVVVFDDELVAVLIVWLMFEMVVVFEVVLILEIGLL